MGVKSADFVTSSENETVLETFEAGVGVVKIKKTITYTSPEFLSFAEFLGTGKAPNANFGGELGGGVGLFGAEVTWEQNQQTGTQTIQVAATIFGAGFDGTVEIDSNNNIVSVEGFTGGQIILGGKGGVLGVGLAIEGKAQVGIFFDTEGIDIGADLDITLGAFAGTYDFEEEHRIRIYEFEDPDSCFLAGTPIAMWDGTEKLIEEIEEGDWVVSYDKGGNLVPGRVSRAMQRQAECILDVHGLMVTPGHVTLCGDGRFNGCHVPIIDILRSDGALVRKDGSKIRASTGCQLGSAGDRMVCAVAGQKHPDGSVQVRDVGHVRLGTRFIVDHGKEVSVIDLIDAAGGVVNENGMVKVENDGPELPFFWFFTPMLPNPEDYVLQRSQIQLNEIYQADEWEAVAPQLPSPLNREMHSNVGDSRCWIRAEPPANQASTPTSSNTPDDVTYEAHRSHSVEQTVSTRKLSRLNQH